MLSLSLEIFFWATLFVGSTLLLFCMVYSLVLYGDLSRDFINPVELCELLNRITLWEYGGHLCIAALLLSRGFFFTCAMQIPLIAFHMQRVRSNSYILDNTHIFVDMQKERRICEYKLGFYLVSFFWCLFRFIMFLVEDP
jgi:protein cornichon